MIDDEQACVEYMRAATTPRHIGEAQSDKRRVGAWKIALTVSCVLC